MILPNSPNEGRTVLDTAGDEEADVDVLIDNEKAPTELVVPEDAVGLVTPKPEAEPVAPETVAVLVKPKPVKDPVLPEEVAELAGAVVETVIADDEAVATNAGKEEDWIELLEAGVEVVVVVTVENNGAADVAKVKEVGFEAEEEGLPNEKLEELVEVDVREGAAEDAVVVVDAEPLGNDKPDEDEKGAAEFDLKPEPLEKEVENEGVFAAEDEADEPNKLVVENAEEAVAGEDENEDAPKGDEFAVANDDPNRDVPGAVDAAVPNRGELELAPKDDDENKDKPELAEDTDVPNKDGPGEPAVGAEGAAPKMDVPELAVVKPAPNKDGADDPAEDDAPNGDGAAVVVAEAGPNKNDGAEVLEDGVEVPNPNDRAEAELVVEAAEEGKWEKDEEDGAEEEVVFKEKENGGAEEVELGFENPVDGAEASE
ncbi:hypothetical protein O6P43_017351 [Quillaja saponaria]|uniref:Uncharacterized protein n=1 Tax=Quillaja saponaria TaxID=32244 RepID=A0AAD7LQ69_QUISA|nr:hypothetical protein O6P43_017351 [Quillaja saponaria]